jgi:hypothetical protein
VIISLSIGEGVIFLSKLLYFECFDMDINFNARCKWTLNNNFFFKENKCIQPYIIIKNTRPITCILDADRPNIERLSEVFSHLLNTSLKLPVGVSPLQLVNLHRNRRYFVIKLHTWFCLSYVLKTSIKFYCIYQYFMSINSFFNTVSVSRYSRNFNS